MHIAYIAYSLTCLSFLFLQLIVYVVVVVVVVSVEQFSGADENQLAIAIEELTNA
jgi:hypothetical protein